MLSSHLHHRRRFTVNLCVWWEDVIWQLLLHSLVREHSRGHACLPNGIVKQALIWELTPVLDAEALLHRCLSFCLFREYFSLFREYFSGLTWERVLQLSSRDNEGVYRPLMKKSAPTIVSLLSALISISSDFTSHWMKNPYSTNNFRAHSNDLLARLQLPSAFRNLTAPSFCWCSFPYHFNVLLFVLLCFWNLFYAYF